MNHDYPFALPVFSVDTPEQAELLFQRIGQKGVDNRYYITLPEFQGKLEDIERVNTAINRLVSEQPL